MDIEEYNGIKVVAISTESVGGNSVACDKCCFCEHCLFSDSTEDFPCYIEEEKQDYPYDICFRQATPEEIQQASIDDSVELVSKAMPKIMEIPCSDEPQGRKK